MALQSVEPAVGKKEMTMDAVYSTVKAFACGGAALALTAVLSWSFVESTSVARWVPAQSSAQVANAAVDFASHTAQSTVAALVD
jgi:hypothetical protein